MSLRILDRLLLLVATLVALGIALGLIFLAVALMSGEPLQTTLALRWLTPTTHDVVLKGGNAVVGTLTVDHATLDVRAGGGGGYMLAQFADICLVGGIWLFVTLAVRRVVAGVASGDPFGGRAVASLRAIGWALIALNLWGWIRVTLVPLVLLRQISLADGLALYPAVSLGVAGPGAQIDAHLSFTLLICGLLVLAIGEAFRIGRDLRAENQAFV